MAPYERFEHLVVVRGEHPLSHIWRRDRGDGVEFGSHQGVCEVIPSKEEISVTALSVGMQSQHVQVIAIQAEPSIDIRSRNVS